ncbi:hypothetical protein Dsin_001138 [Dipteronia sinensis]|uniref:Uncharacterized protein n=1 Tax=Dipteronia sinensis TaxID=43782 RepID=A0AAE0B4K0_9ROSI|nr:hypothetical protein Dsin_001138 [Dipteronia sinensis]
MRQDINKKWAALKDACRYERPGSWKEINGLETHLNEALSVEEKYWCQKARVDWLKFGYRNTSFFRYKASTKRAQNKINGLLDDKGIRWDSKLDMEKIISDYFSSLFSFTNLSQQALDSVLEKSSQNYQGLWLVFWIRSSIGMMSLKRCSKYYH